MMVEGDLSAGRGASLSRQHTSPSQQQGGEDVSMGAAASPGGSGMRCTGGGAASSRPPALAAAGYGTPSSPQWGSPHAAMDC